MKTHHPASSATKGAYLGSWLVFIAVILIMEGWSKASPLYLFIAGVGVVGVVAAALWAFGNGKWLYVALVCSLTLIAAYVLWWIVDIGYRYESDPNPGLLRTVSVQLEIWLSMARAFIGRSHYLYAFCQLYWGVLMPLLQFAFLASMVRSVKSLRKPAAESLAV